MAAARVLLVLACAGVVGGLLVPWAVLGEVGWTAYGELPDGPMWDTIGEERVTGWEPLEAFAVLPVLAAVALLARRPREPSIVHLVEQSTANMRGSSSRTARGSFVGSLRR